MLDRICNAIFICYEHLSARSCQLDLVISNIKAGGDQTTEYVFIKVVRDCDVGAYLLADTTYSGGHEVS